MLRTGGLVERRQCLSLADSDSDSGPAVLQHDRIIPPKTFKSLSAPTTLDSNRWRQTLSDIALAPRECLARQALNDVALRRDAPFPSPVAFYSRELPDCSAI